MDSDLKHFLLVYNRDVDELVEVQEFEDGLIAAEEYALAERAARHTDARVDVLLVGSDSLDTAKVTHSNYFTGKARERIRNLLRNLSSA